MCGVGVCTYNPITLLFLGFIDGYRPNMFEQLRSFNHGYYYYYSFILFHSDAIQWGQMHSTIMMRKQWKIAIRG